MMTLKTNSHKISASSALVQWGVTDNKNGIIHVSLDFETEDPALICELIVIKHLLFEKQVFDREPKSGKGYRLIVSNGAIKKLVKGKSDKRFAAKYATFLTFGRMTGAEIEVSQKKFPVQTTVAVHLEARKECYSSDYEFIETPKMGKIGITRHAVERYQERISSGKPKNPWASLCSRLENEALTQRPLNERVLKHKAKKYGPGNMVEMWAHPDSSFCFMFVRDKDTDCRVLVTCFERNESGIQQPKYQGAFPVTRNH